MKKKISRKEKLETALKILNEIKPNEKEVEQIRKFVQPLNNILWQVEEEKRQKKIESIKKPILDILSKSTNRPLKHILIASRLYKKLGKRIVKFREVMDALHQLVKEGRVKYDDDLHFYLAD